MGAKVAYRRFVPTFWNDPDVKEKLTLEEKAFLSYLFTNEHGHPCGVYRLPLIFIADELGLTTDQSLRMITGPCALFCTYDVGTQEIFVHAMAKHQIDEDGLHGKDKRIPWVEKQLAAVRAKHLVRAFRERYGDWNLNWEPLVPGPRGNGGRAPQSKGHDKDHNKDLTKDLDKALTKQGDPEGAEPEGDLKSGNGLTTPEVEGHPKALGKPAAATAPELSGLVNPPAVPDIPESPGPPGVGFIHPGRRLSASQVLQAWESRLPQRPSEFDRRKQWRAARSIADNHTAEQVMLAFVGMGAIWPYCPPRNQAWDLVDLERKFVNAMNSAQQHPEIRSAQREAELLELLEGVG